MSLEKLLECGQTFGEIGDLLILLLQHRVESLDRRESHAVGIDVGDGLAVPELEGRLEVLGYRAEGSVL